MPRRLLQIVSTLEIGERTATMAAVSQWAAQQGMEVEVWGLHGGGSLAAGLRADGIQVRWIEPPVRHAGQLVYQTRNELRRWRPDVVHSWTDEANWVGRLAAVAVSVPRLIASVRWLPHPRNLWHQSLDRALALRTDAYVVNSRTAYVSCQRRGLSELSLRLILDGIQPGVPTNLKHRMSVRQQLGVAPTARLIGAAGPLVSSKRWKDLIWAADLLRVFYRDIHLVLIGDGPLRWRLERYARQVHDRRRTIFMGHRDDWLDLIRGMDCVAQVGQQESQPYGLLAAMAAGVPVIASDIPGHRELIEPDRTGRLFPLGDRGAIARQLYTLIDNPATAQRLAAAAGDFVSRRRRIESMFAAYRPLYFDAAPLAPPPRLMSGGDQPEHSLRTH